MAYLAVAIAVFLAICVGYSVYMRRREALARRAWQLKCDELARANDAARALQRTARGS